MLENTSKTIGLLQMQITEIISFVNEYMYKINAQIQVMLHRKILYEQLQLYNL